MRLDSAATQTSIGMDYATAARWSNSGSLGEFSSATAATWPMAVPTGISVEYGSVKLLSQVLSIRVMLEILVETTA
jgi:hypothetical protein